MIEGETSGNLPLQSGDEEKTVVARLVYIPDDDPGDNLTNSRALREAQCPPSEIRHGWYPNLGGQK